MSDWALTGFLITGTACMVGKICAIIHEPVCHVSYPEPIHLIELSSGSSAKTRYLLEAPVANNVYMPIDIAKEQLLSSTLGLA